MKILIHLCAEYIITHNITNGFTDDTKKIIKDFQGFNSEGFIYTLTKRGINSILPFDYFYKIYKPNVSKLINAICESSNLNVMEYLIKNKIIDINEKHGSKNLIQPFFIHGNLEIIKLMLDYGYTEFKNSFRTSDRVDMNNVLCLLISNKHSHIAKYLIRRGYNNYYELIYGVNILNVMSFYHIKEYINPKYNKKANDRFIKYIIKKNKELPIQEFFNNIQFISLSLIKFMMRYINISDLMNREYIISAARNNSDINVLKYFISRGIKPNEN